MFGVSQPTKRFSLLLLEEGEDYVANWVARCNWPQTVSGNWQSLDTIDGTLRLCSKSIFFESDDFRTPIVRLPLKTTQNLEPQGSQTFTLSSTYVVKMKANLADAPYQIEKGIPIDWRFRLSFAQLSDVLPLVHQYLAASRLPTAEKTAALQALVQKRGAAAMFDTSRLVDFMEALHYEGLAALVTPLIKELGRLVITSTRLYFQPLDNVAGNNPVQTHLLAEIAAVVRRRSSLQPLGVEVFFVNTIKGRPNWGAPSAFFAFTSEGERDHFLSNLTKESLIGSALLGGTDAAVVCASVLEGHGDWLEKVTKGWQHGHVSNFDYLLFCNLAAGRSFNDLTQWPIFPWILADYDSHVLDLDRLEAYRNLSLPMGAINPARLKLLLKRYREMPKTEGIDRPFLYGTHYSCPGYVMFWLVRAAPGHLLRLQNGRFDSADRLFINIRDSYMSATSNAADVRELIPEFFLPDPKFLINVDQLPLGIRQNGLPVGDVELPKWAKSPSDFLLQHRAALESSIVSANLHHWIDLIFGFKQQGSAAVEANNVFHTLTYEGAIDIAAMSDAQEKHALEVQINEFGQCPQKIFSTPHPARLACPSAAEATSIAKKAFSNGQSSEQGVLGGQKIRPLSLALLNTIVAATSNSDAQIRQNAMEEASIKALDMTALQDGNGDTPSGQNPNTRSEDADNKPLAATKQVPNSNRASSERLREWGSSLRGSLGSFAENLTTEAARSKLAATYLHPKSEAIRQWVQGGHSGASTSDRMKDQKQAER